VRQDQGQGTGATPANFAAVMSRAEFACSRLGGAAWTANAIIEDVWRLDGLAGISNLMNPQNGPAPAVYAPVGTAHGKNQNSSIGRIGDERQQFV